MSEHFVRIIVNTNTLNSIEKLAHDIGAEVSEPLPSDDFAGGLNAPMGGADDIISLCQILTALFGSGIAFIEFITKLIELLDKLDTSVTLINPKTNKRVIVDANSSVDQIEKEFNQDG